MAAITQETLDEILSVVDRAARKYREKLKNKIAAIACQTGCDEATAEFPRKQVTCEQVLACVFEWWQTEDANQSEAREKLEALLTALFASATTPAGERAP